MATKQRLPKPFPHRCPECGTTAVYPETTNYRTAFKYEGHLHEFEATNITLNKCRECGGIILPNTALEQITEAFRLHANLLTAEKIRGELQRLRLSQKEFGQLLAVAPETVSRWLTSVQVQTRSLDRFMRLFFTSSEVRENLAGMKAGVLPTEGTGATRHASSPGSRAGLLDPGPELQTSPVGFRASHKFSRTFSPDVLIRQQSFQPILSFS